ncbi:hypothetical protein [Piscinibacter terrae]|uniref:Uncharacterized protein n=1 Tax=Piscinibacter terrae TaxID=2496871 RepID=A0A3N7HPE8_9BURK|nr:hypothetical protein [Albitalea terrae]RQP24067.1 hypothetical protein DZC73_12070 [Albitalea terrae]
MHLSALAPPRGYVQVRLQASLRALVELLKRWQVYIVVGLLVLGSAGNGALAAMSAMTAWSVFPLLQATQVSMASVLLTGLAHSMVGAVAIWGLRPVLWQRAWMESENALPIAPRERRRADLLVVVLGLAPLFAIYAAGVLVWLARSPAWMHHGWVEALAGLGLSMGLSVAWGVLILGAMRRVSPARPAGTRRSRRGWRRAMTPLTALAMLPLWRGPAQRTGRMMVLVLIALGVPCLAMVAWPGWASWWLAGFGAAAFMLTSRLSVLASQELAPLHLHAAALPVSPRRLLLARRLAVVVPQLMAQALCTAALMNQPRALRPGVLAAFMSVLLAGSAVQVLLTTQPSGHRPTDPAHRVSQWLFTLVLILSLASEVILA